jgi:ribosomal protein S3
MPSLKDSMIFLPSIRATLYFFKIMPFLTGLKLICEKYLESIFASVYEREVYLMNMSKPNAIDAGVILHFVEVFLRRRRRVTKINKLFYRLIKILRFFRGKYRLRGFKFLLAGRFLRRDRATFIWRTRGAVPLGTKLAKIDFATRSMQMKYSRPIAKLWICRR